MHITDILSPERTIAQVPATSKKRALETISTLLAASTNAALGATEIFDSLIARNVWVPRLSITVWPSRMVE